MKTSKFAAIFALLFAGQVVANEQPTAQADEAAPATRLTEIVLQHEYVEQFKHFKEPRFTPLRLIVRNNAQHLTDPGIVATIRARDEKEGLLVAATYQREGATIPFNIVSVPNAEVVTITFDRAEVAKD